MSNPQLKRQPPCHCCPYCLKPVGYLGRLFAWLFGTKIHYCTSSNVLPPNDGYEYRWHGALLKKGRRHE